MHEHTIFWRRLDKAGADACRIIKEKRVWTIQGTAVFLGDNGPAWLHYVVTCNDQWMTKEARVSGYTGAAKLDIKARRGTPGRWMVNGEVIRELDNLDDVDLGFTPATNTNAIRRMALDIGETAVNTAVYLDTSDWTIKPLHQRYKRMTHDSYQYDSPSHDYQAVLRTDAFGCVVDYPDLWRAERL